MLERVLLGDSPFIGADPLIQDRAKESLAQLKPEDMVRVMRTSFASGADGFVFYTHPTNLSAFKLLSSQDPEISFDMYPLFPYARDYVRDAAEMGTVGLLMERVKRLTLAGKVKAVFEGGLAALTLDPHRMLAMTLEAEVEDFLKAAPRRARLKGVFLHDVIVDLSVALGLREIIETHITSVADTFGVKPGLVTRNFTKLVDFLENTNLPTKELMIMAPFNSLGFQMNPSRQSCEETLANRNYLDVVAMGLLSAGILDLPSALAYIKGLKNLSSVVVGASREEHALTTFAALTSLKKMTLAIA
ncbi:MAG TPA: hypothetical protein VNA15_03760 [Candidatus Angelobacter sp.]|nr:hypothetical protein [Candidatus Angelobacter sp.]